MSRPDPIRGRFFQRVSDGAWLARVDTQSPLSTAEAEQRCTAEYGFPVRAVEVTIATADFDSLAAQRRVGAVMPPARPAPAPTTEQAAFAAATSDGKLAMLAGRLGLA